MPGSSPHAAGRGRVLPFRAGSALGVTGSVAAAALAGWLMWWPPDVERTVDAAAIQAVGDRQYYVELDDLTWPGLIVPADDNDHPRQSPLQLFENGRPLGPAHAEHSAIRARGDEAAK